MWCEAFIRVDGTEWGGEGASTSHSMDYYSKLSKNMLNKQTIWDR